MNLKFYENTQFLPEKKTIQVFSFLAIFFFIASCNIINPAEPIPAYIHIDSISLTTNQATQGTNSAKIVDAWVYVDGDIIGAFELPVTIPVLKAGIHKITILPGILIDGISASRTNYPFYNSFDTTISFESAHVQTILPKTIYPTSVQFEIEDFDQPGRNMVRTSGSDTDFVLVMNEHSFEGKSGAVYLDNAHPFFEAAWKDSFLLPVASPAYVELNYKSENPFTVGLITYLNNTVYYDDIVNFRASQTWKKVYIFLGPVLSNGLNATGFKVYLKATKNFDLGTATLYFDNIKVVYR